MSDSVHYAFWHVCCTFIPACTCEHTYDDGTALWTTVEAEATCQECIKTLKEWSEYEYRKKPTRQWND